MANAIVGSGKVLVLATLFGLPIGFLGGVYLSEYASAGSAFALRYVTDLLNGVPSIVIGIVTYALVVKRMGHFSTLAGGVALGVMMIPIAVRSTEEFLHAVPQMLREGGLALGRPKWRVIATVVIPAAVPRDSLRHHARPGAGRRGNRAAARSPRSTTSSGARAGTSPPRPCR